MEGKPFLLDDIVEVYPDEFTSVSDLSYIYETKDSASRFYNALKYTSSISLYTIYYLSDSERINVGGFLEVNPTTGVFSIPKPLIMFKDSFESAIKKAKSEIGGVKTIIFLALLTAAAGYLTYR